MSKADAIKLSAVITAIPRWVVALLAADGLSMPHEWLWLWVVFSAVSAAGMAIVEGIAFAYVFGAVKEAWKLRQSAHLWTLGSMAFVSAFLFVAMLTPSIAASVRGVTVGEWISNDFALMIWAAIVAASTIAIVASVGYAETISQPAATKPVITVSPIPQASKPPETTPQIARVSLPIAKVYPKRFTELSQDEKTELIAKVQGMDRAQGVKVIAQEVGISEQSGRKWFDVLTGA